MRSRFSLLSLGASLVALPWAVAQTPDALPVKPRSPQAILSGVPAPLATPPIMPSAPAKPGVAYCLSIAAPAKPKTRVFEVADLILAPVPIPGATADKTARSHALVKLIIEMVKPDSWERHGGAGKIEFIAASDSICATNSPKVLAEVAELIEALRRLQDQQVTVEMRLITVPAGFGAKAGWLSAVAKEKFCTPDELKTALEAVAADKRVNVITSPKMTMVDGQMGYFRVGEVRGAVVPGGKTVLKSSDAIEVVGYQTLESGIQLECTPTISADGKSIQLKMKSGVNALTCDSTLALPAGHSAIALLGKEQIEVRTQTRVPVLSKVPYLNRLFTNTGIGIGEQEIYQIVTARIINLRELDRAAAPCCRTPEVKAVDFQLNVPAAPVFRFETVRFHR